MTSNDELKPCPFCKNAGNIKLVEYRPNCSGAVVCGRCGARGPKKKNDHKRGWKKKAIEGWNTRAERTCRFALEEDREKLAEKADCGPGEFVTQDMPQLLWTCSACGVQYRNSFDVLPAWMKHCPECGAKVVE